MPQKPKVQRESIKKIQKFVDVFRDRFTMLSNGDLKIHCELAYNSNGIERRGAAFIRIICSGINHYAIGIEEPSLWPVERYHLDFNPEFQVYT